MVNKYEQKDYYKASIYNDELFTMNPENIICAEYYPLIEGSIAYDIKVGNRSEISFVSVFSFAFKT